MPDLETFPRVYAGNICIHGWYLHAQCQIADELLRFSWTVKTEPKADGDAK